MSQSQLQPPWNTDQYAINALLVKQGAREGLFREDMKQAVWCRTCTGKDARRLVRLFVGPVDDDATGQLLMVPAYQLAGRSVPALCAPVPRAGEPWSPMYGHCARCRTGVEILFDDADGWFADQRAACNTMRSVIRFGKPRADEYAAGDQTTYVEGDTWSKGPAGSWLLHVGAPTLGVAAE